MTNIQLKKTINLNEGKLINLLKNLVPSLEKTSNYWDSTDIFSTQKNLVIELKCRNAHYDTILIEKKKYDAIMASEFKNKRFIASTPSGVWCWDLCQIEEPVWAPTWLPTDESKREYTWKDAGYLPITTALNIRDLLGL